MAAGAGTNENTDFAGMPGEAGVIAPSLARAGLDKAWEIVRAGEHDLLILDEINVVADFNLVPAAEVLELVKARPRWMDIIATGRSAPATLVEAADTVSEVREVKHHYRQGLESRAGMEY